MPVAYVVRLTMCDEHADGSQLVTLGSVPNRSRVVIDVGYRRSIPIRTAEGLRHHGARLDLEIVGSSPKVIRAWRDAINGGDVL